MPAASKTLLLREAYDFGRSHGLVREVDEIQKKAIAKWERSYSSSVRRGYIVALFARNNLLTEFARAHWSFGKTLEGEALRKRYLDIKDAYERRATARPASAPRGRSKPKAKRPSKPATKSSRTMAPAADVDFGMYEQLRARVEAGDAKGLSSQWLSFCRQRMSAPQAVQSGIKSLTGHVPYAHFNAAFGALGELLDQKGIYVWGAWSAGATTPQYIGMTDISFRERFRRYVIESRTGKHREINMAEGHAAALLKLPNDWRPMSKTSTHRFDSAAIPVPKGRATRAARAERYAKVGLENLWYFLIPARPGASGRELKRVEGALVAITNAELFRRCQVGEAHSFPLLNMSGVKATNSHVPSDQLSAFVAWLDGSWHEQNWNAKA